MKKLLLLTFCFCFFTSFLYAQPALVWAKQMGGSSSDVSNSVKVDASGNVYTIGYFSGIADFDPAPESSTWQQS